MDLFDEVLNIEENAYKEGERIGKERGQKIAAAQSHEEGKDNGYYIAREYGFIQGYTSIVDKEEHIRERHQKVIQNIYRIQISPAMPAEEINEKMIELRNLYKKLLSLLKIKNENSTSTDLF